MTRTRFQVTTSLALVVILLALLVMPVAAQSPITRIRNGILTYLTVNETATLDSLILPKQTSITVANDTVITPLGSYQPISSAGTVGTASITVQAAGFELTLVNTAATTITFTDTGTLKLTGNIALGQYDTLRLISDGTNWLQLSTANN